MIDDFSKAPVSIGEARADKSGQAKDISPREMLVSLLRDIDTGKLETPDFIVVCMARRDVGGDAIMTSEWVAGDQNPLEVYGLLWRCSLRLCDDTRS